jgi:beta-lactamase regulating signal transducer with metallopeptidase domain
MTWQTICDPTFSGRLCMTLVHSMWQVALLAAIAWGFDRLWRRRSAQRSYTLHVTALIAGLAAMPITYAIVDVDMPGTAVQGGLTGDSTSPAAPPVAWELDSARSFVDHGEETPKVSDLSPDPGAAAPASVRAAANQGSARWLQVAPWVVSLYAVGVLFMLVRLIGGTWRASRLSSGAQLIGDGALAERLNSLARKWSMRIVPSLARAEEIVVPKVVGLVRPMILLPVSVVTCLSMDELEMILAHELAHVRRYDMWVNLTQRVAEVVLFFNPALWYLSRRTSALREYCCDELTCRATSGSDAELRTRYASALLRIVELSRQGATCRVHARTFESGDLATLAASGRSPSDLRRRVARLFGEPLHEPVRLSRGGLLMLAVLAAVLLTAPTAWRSIADTAAAPTENTDRKSVV